MIICGDTPLLDGCELKKFYVEHQSSGAAATVLTAILDNPTGYGRILRDCNGHVIGIVEEKDATMSQKSICEINTGIYCIEAPLLFEALSGLTCDNAQGEYYLTDVPALIRMEGGKVGLCDSCSPQEMLGVNTPEQLAEVETLVRAGRG